MVVCFSRYEGWKINSFYQIRNIGAILNSNYCKYLLH